MSHLFNPLAASPYNRVIARMEVDHLLQKCWCQIIYYTNFAFMLYFILFHFSIKCANNDELYIKYLTGFTTAIYIRFLELLFKCIGRGLRICMLCYCKKIYIYLYDKII